MHEHLALQSSPCEDGLHLLAVYGPPDFTRGDAQTRRTAYLEGLRHFPAVLNPRLLEQATQVTDVAVAPETMLRGHVRQAAGPGWVLVGDAGLTSHPSTAQGIGEAVAQGWYVGTHLGDRASLADYERWRDDRVAGHLEFSFRAGHLPTPEARVVQAGLAADPVAGQEFLDTFAKAHRPAEVLTPARIARWKAAWVYETGLRDLLDTLGAADDELLSRQVPACPQWRVRDLLAHLAGLAEDSAQGGFFAGAMDAWAEPGLARIREQWTDGHVRRHADASGEQLLRALARHGETLAAAIRRGTAPVAGAPDWGWSAPVGDLAVHAADLREALDLPPAQDRLSAYGFAAYRAWLDQRLRATGADGLVLTDGTDRWTLGPDAPRAPVLTADRHTLFRVLTGRRSAVEIRALTWAGDPTDVLGLIAPYPLPEPTAAAPV